MAYPMTIHGKIITESTKARFRRSTGNANDNSKSRRAQALLLKFPQTQPDHHHHHRDHAHPSRSNRIRSTTVSGKPFDLSPSSSRRTNTPPLPREVLYHIFNLSWSSLVTSSHLDRWAFHTRIRLVSTRCKAVVDDVISETIIIECYDDFRAYKNLTSWISRARPLRFEGSLENAQMRINARDASLADPAFVQELVMVFPQATPGSLRCLEIDLPPPHAHSIDIHMHLVKLLDVYKPWRLVLSFARDSPLPRLGSFNSVTHLYLKSLPQNPEAVLVSFPSLENLRLAVPPEVANDADADADDSGSDDLIRLLRRTVPMLRVLGVHACADDGTPRRYTVLPWKLDEVIFQCFRNPKKSHIIIHHPDYQPLTGRWENIWTAKNLCGVRVVFRGWSPQTVEPVDEGAGPRRRSSLVSRWLALPPAIIRRKTTRAERQKKGRDVIVAPKHPMDENDDDAV